MAFAGYFEAPLAKEAKCGLFSVAEVVRHDVDDARWTYGYDQYFVTPDGVQVLSTEAGSAAQAVPGSTFPADDIRGTTFEVVIEEEFSGMGANHVTPFAGLQDVMDAATQRAAEYALWSGPGIQENTDAHWLFDADATAVVAAGADARAMLAEAEGAMGGNVTGIQGVIHMSRKTASLLGSAVRYDDGEASTRLGSPIVAGTGYGHTGTDGSVAVTGPVIVHLGPVVVNDTDLRNNFDPNTNTYRVRVSRVVSVVFDPSLHVKISVS